MSLKLQSGFLFPFQTLAETTTTMENTETPEESILEDKSPEVIKSGNNRKRTLFNGNEKMRLDISSDDCSQVKKA